MAFIKANSTFQSDHSSRCPEASDLFISFDLMKIYFCHQFKYCEYTI